VTRLSLRARLIAATGTLLAGALVLFGLLFYALLADYLARSFDNSLRASAAEVASALTPDLHETMDADDIRPGVLEPMAVDDASRPGVFVQILDVRGRVVATSGTRLPINRMQVRRVLTGVEDVGWAGADDRLRVLARPVYAHNGEIAGVVQVAQSAHFLDATLAEVRNLIVGGTLLTVLVAGGAGWWLIGRAMRPIRDLTAAADRIVETGRLDARIATPGAADEVGTLVKRFNSMVEQLERSFEQQRQLLADTSHELRNPLTAIRANLEIIEGMDGPEALFEAAGEAKSEAIRMSRLVNDLLLLGQTDASQAIDRQSVDLRALVERIADRARLVSAGQTVDASDLEPVSVIGDADRLYQAVWNLVENALHCTPSTGRVWLRLRHDRDHDRVSIEVEDNGPGIAPEHQSRIFERLYRVDAGRSRRSGGAGLGLAIVKWVAEAHGGSATMTSVVGQGSRFEIVLPAAPNAYGGVWTEAAGAARLA
jgi:signal transduction histidine kinase